MRQYLDLVKQIMREGKRKDNRTGVSTVSTFGCFYKVDLRKGFPLLTTKKVAFKVLVDELFWYLTGDAHIAKAPESVKKIWNSWADEKGLLETAYGRFWRKFPLPSGDEFAVHGAPGEVWDLSKWTSHDPVTGIPVFDQIQYIVDCLKEIKTNPTSRNLRRLVVSAWHPANASISKLPPCHYTFCFNVEEGNILNCHMTQRSADVALGVPFNLACYALLTMMIAKECGYIAGEFAHTLVDAHIYEDQMEGLHEQVLRIPRKLPTIKIDDVPFNELKPENIHLIDYNPYPAIKFPQAAV